MTRVLTGATSKLGLMRVEKTFSLTPYGSGDATFKALGGEQGIETLVDHFYSVMEDDGEFASIWSMHTAEREEMRARLAAFLCGWTGGPRRYSERFGSINIPEVHRELNVLAEHRDLWLQCMARAVDKMDYAPQLVEYLLAQLAIPAQRIVDVCAVMAEHR